MHEFSITSQIVRAVLQEAQKRGAKGVLEVHLVIGTLTFLGIEQVKFSYQILVEDTILHGSKLIIHHKSGKVKCERCGYEGSIPFKEDPVSHTSFPSLTCHQCESPVRIIEGKECTITRVKLVM
jgi:hydrogenase nickel incorporation protein HypA/HybF